MARTWMKKEEEFLKKHYRKMSIEELAGKFDVFPDAIRRKEKRLGLIREHPHRKKEKKIAPSAPRKWTEKEELYLRENYLKESNIKLAERFRTTPKSVEKKLWRMGLKKRKVKKVDMSLGGERKKGIEEFLRRQLHPIKKEEKVDERRPQAIARFEAAIQLYYAKKYEQAESSFGKLIKDFADLYDVVYKAKQYTKFCQSKI